MELDASFRVRGFTNLYVADASVYPEMFPLSSLGPVM